LEKAGAQMPIDTATAPELLATTAAVEAVHHGGDADGDMSVHHHPDEDDDETPEDDSMNPTYSNTVRSKRRRKIQPNEEENEMTLSLPSTQNDVEEDRRLTQPPHSLQQLPDNRFELELEFVQALASPAYLHFLATSRLVMEDLNTSVSKNDNSSSGSNNNNTTTTTTATATATTNNIGTTQQSTLQQLQPFLHYLYRTYSQPQYARFLRYPHALYMLHALLIPTTTTTYHGEDAATTSTNTNATTTSTNTTMAHSHRPTVPDDHDHHHQLWTEWTIPGFRNFAHQQQFLAWQHRHTVCYGVGTAPIPTPHHHTGASGDDGGGGGGSSSKSSSSIKASTSTTSSSKKLETSSEITNNNSNDNTMQPNKEEEKEEDDHDIVTVDNSNIANT
jgi:SOH1